MSTFNLGKFLDTNLDSRNTRHVWKTVLIKKFSFMNKVKEVIITLKMWSIICRFRHSYTANVYPMKTMATGNCENCNYHWVSLQFLQPFSIDSAGFPCRDPAIPSPCSFHGVKICSVALQIWAGHISDEIVLPELTSDWNSLSSRTWLKIYSFLKQSQ